jgi:hypothetical protein
LSIYIVVFLLLALSVFIESFGDKISSAIILIGTVMLLLFITSNREGIGTDFYSYKEIYREVTIDNSFSVEFGFVVLNYIAYCVGGFKVLLLITAFLNLLAIVFVLRKFGLHISLGVLTYYSLFYLNHNFNTLRHGLMSAFVWVALYFFFKRDRIKSICFHVISILFHQLAFVFYPLQFLTAKRINYKYSIVLLSILFIVGESLTDAFAFLNIFISQYSNKLNYYLNDYYGDDIVKYNFGLGFFLYVAIYFIILKFEDYFTNRTQIVFFNRLLFLGISMIILFASISIFSERIANTLLLSLVFIFASVGKIKIEILPRFILLFVLVAIDFFYLMKVISIPGVDRTYQFVPYTYTFF